MQIANHYKRMPGAFTLVEMLVSMGLVIVLVALFTKAFGDVSAMSGSLRQQADMMSSGRIALERVGGAIRGTVRSTDVGLIAARNVGAGSYNDGLAMIVQGRTRARSGVSEANVRFAINGFGVRTLEDAATDLPGPRLAWGEGVIVYQPLGAAQVEGDLSLAMAAAAEDVRLDQVEGDLLQFNGLGDGVFRFELCYLLDDGSIVSVPPRHLTMDVGSFTNVTGIALRAEESADTNRRYVKAVVVGIAVIDSRARLHVDDLEVLGNLFPDPPTGQTPLQTWDLQDDASSVRIALLNSYPLTVVNGIRVFQQYYYVQ